MSGVPEDSSSGPWILGFEDSLPRREVGRGVHSDQSGGGRDKSEEGVSVSFCQGVEKAGWGRSYHFLRTLTSTLPYLTSVFVELSLVIGDPVPEYRGREGHRDSL